MKNKLLPQDVHLLTTKWSDPEHLPLDQTVGPQAWRKQYKQRLEQTIAGWLAKGLVAYQYPQRRHDAFVPVSHLIGTSKDSISYIDSFVDIAGELELVRDPMYRSHPNEAFPEDDFVSLGECFSGGIARAAELLARRLGEDDAHQEQCFQALGDALTLIQAVKPHNAGSALYLTWSELHGKASNRFDEMSEKHPWVMEHALVLACYPVCNIGVGSDVKSLIDNLEAKIRRRAAPSILKSDLKACRDLLSVGKLNFIERVSVGHQDRLSEIPSTSLDPIKAWYPTSKISSRHRYVDVGVCYAR